jgi:HK97 family phage portal protein
MDRLKTIVNIPGWARDLQESPDRVSSTSEAYAYVPLIFRALRLRCDAVASVPERITKGEQPAEWPWKETPLPELLWRTEASLLLTGAAYWLKLRNRVKVLGIQWLNPLTMSVHTEAVDEVVRGIRTTRRRIYFEQSAGGEEPRRFEADEIVYFREFNPANDVGPGVSAVQVALTDAQLMRYMSRFAARFFEGGAMPVTMVGVENAQLSPSERERVEGFFKRSITSISNAFKVLVLSAGIKPAVLTPPLNTLAMPELSDASRRNIASAFGIPQTMLEDAANYATAREHRLSFWQDTVRPREVIIEGGINRQLLEPLGYHLELAWNEMDVFQADEAERAESLQRLVTAGFPLDLAAEVLGMELTDEQWERLRDEVERKNDEARRVLAEADPANSVGQNQANADADVSAEMRRWERKALRRIKDGKPAVCEFESEVIPDSLAAVISEGLSAASTPDEVKAVFDQHEPKPAPVVDLAAELKRANDMLERING